MIKKILFAAFIVTAIIAGAYGYFYLKNLKKPKILAIEAIPQQCSFVLESENFLEEFKKLNETNLIWDELKQVVDINELNRNYQVFDSLISKDDKIRSIFNNNKVYISAYPTTENAYHYLFTLNLPDINYTDEVAAYIKKNCIKQRKIDVKEGGSIFEAYFRSADKAGYFYLHSGLLAMSSDSLLIKKLVNEKGKQVLANDNNFLKLEESAGTEAGFRFFFNHEYSEEQCSALNKKIKREGIFNIKNVKGWTELDIDFTPNEMMLNGYTYCDSSALIKALGNQNPCEIKFPELAPLSTKAFAFMGISSREKFAYDILFHSESQEVKNKYDKKLDTDLMNSVQQLADEELVVLQTREHDTSAVYALARVNDSRKALNLLMQTADSIFVITPGDSAYVYRDAELFHVFSFELFTFQPRYCALVENYILFSESMADIIRYKACLQQNQTLARNESYKHFSENHLGTEANFYLYTYFSQSISFLGTFFNEKINELFLTYVNMFEKFNAIGYQLTASKGKLFNQAYVLYSPIENLQTNSVWETQLDTVSNMMPQIVLNHKTKGKEIFTQDEHGKVYLISNTGKIVWTKKIEGKILGQVYQVDYFKNEKLQILFNTELAIHLIDRNGNYLQGYPLYLKAKATNALSVFDYESNKDYRLLLACEDKKIYNYNLSGKVVEGFILPETKAIVNVPIKWLRVNQKDYLILNDSLGNLYGFGRRGETRLKFEHKAPAHNLLTFYEAGKDNSKTYLHFIDDADRQIKKISLMDEMLQTAFQSDLKVKKVKFAPINDDQLIDYALMDEMGLVVYDNDGKSIMSYKSDAELLPILKIINYDNKNYFMLVEKNGESCILLNTDGKQVKTGIYKCSAEPLLNNLNNDAQTYLITNSGTKLVCYTFEIKN